MNCDVDEGALPGLNAGSQRVLATISSQRRLADQTFAVRLHAPELATQIIPGQFFMIRPAGGSDPLLARPFALYDTVLDSDGQVTELEFAYHVIGKMTAQLSEWTAGHPVEIWGPLGNGFPAFAGRHLLCVGGGIGYTPFLAVARETLGLRQYGTRRDRYESLRPAKVSFCYGVQSQRYRADLTDFQPLAELQIHLSTDDGTEGRRGYVTEAVAEILESDSPHRPDGVYCCGPEKMMHAVARICEASQVDCWLSLETPMACGFGACFSCVTKVRTNDEIGWDYRRTCVEGPIFRAADLLIPE